MAYVIQVSWKLASRIRTELHPHPARKLSAHIPLLCLQWKTPDDWQRNCPKHVEFYSKNKFVKLVYLVDFIIRIYHDARSAELQMFHIIVEVFTFQHITTKKGGMMWHSWLKHWATSLKVAGSITDSVIGIFHWHIILPAALWPWGSNQPLTEMSTRSVSCG